MHISKPDRRILSISTTTTILVLVRNSTQDGHVKQVTTFVVRIKANWPSEWRISFLSLLIIHITRYNFGL